MQPIGIEICPNAEETILRKISEKIFLPENCYCAIKTSAFVKKYSETFRVESRKDKIATKLPEHGNIFIIKSLRNVEILASLKKEEEIWTSNKTF